MYTIKITLSFFLKKKKISQNLIRSYKLLKKNCLIKYPAFSVSNIRWYANAFGTSDNASFSSI